MTARGVCPFVFGICSGDPQETVLAAINLLKQRKFVASGDPIA